MVQIDSVLRKPTVEGILRTIPSGIGLDTAKNHTGVVIWNGSSVETYGFRIQDYDKTDYFAEYKMRREFKNQLQSIIDGRHFEYCIVEDVYAGENFDTVRKLLAVNTVIDELIFDRVCTVGNFVRWNKTKWGSAFRTIYKQRGRLKSKIETQGILEYLEWDFYLNNKDKTEAEKRNMFFEDICDACGMLLGVTQQVNMDINLAKSIPVRLSDIKMYYIQFAEESYGVPDKRVQEEGTIGVEISPRSIEKDIILQAKLHPNDVMCAFLPPSKLGVFGMKHKFTFFDGDEGYLIFYKK